MITLVSQMLSGIIAGGMLLFAFFMAPLVFTQLESKVAGKFIRTVFPWYYLVFGCLFTLLTVALFLSSYIVLGSVALACSIGFLIARQFLMPLINKYSDLSMSGDTHAGNAFTKLHKVSVVINMLQIMVIFYVYYSLLVI